MYRGEPSHDLKHQYGYVYFASMWLLYVVYLLSPEHPTLCCHRQTNFNSRLCEKTFFKFHVASNRNNLKKCKYSQYILRDMPQKGNANTPAKWPEP